MRVLLIISGALAPILAGNGFLYYRTKKLARRRLPTRFAGVEPVRTVADLVRLLARLQRAMKTTSGM